METKGGVMPLNIIDFGDNILSEAAMRVSKRLKKIDRAQRLIANGRGILAESKSRLEEFKRRQQIILAEEASSSVLSDKEMAAGRDELGLERKIGKTNDILSVEFLEAGLLASKSIGRLNVLFGDASGTAFHVGHQVLITNHHVFNDPGFAEACEFELNVEENKIGAPKKIYGYSLAPGRFFLANKELDFTLVAFTDPIGDSPPIDSFGWHVLLDVQGKIRIGDPVNIIQHPNGNEKAIVVHNSHFLHLENGTNSEHFCWYSGDTKKGSSGSPVFNNRWEVVALHHKAVPKTNRNGDIVDRNGRVMSKRRVEETPEDIAWLANEGIRASRLVQAIREASITDADQRKIRDDLLALWSAPAAHKRARKAAEGSDV
jgi:endonuclease G